MKYISTTPRHSHDINEVFTTPPGRVRMVLASFGSFMPLQVDVEGFVGILERRTSARSNSFLVKAIALRCVC